MSHERQVLQGLQRDRQDRQRSLLDVQWNGDGVKTDADYVEDAADYIEQNGLWQGGLWPSLGRAFRAVDHPPACLMGSLMIASGHAVGVMSENGNFYRLQDNDYEAVVRYDQLTMRIARYGWKVKLGKSVVDFSDQSRQGERLAGPEHTQKVLDFLREAAKSFREEDGQ